MGILISLLNLRRKLMLLPNFHLAWKAEPFFIWSPSGMPKMVSGGALPVAPLRAGCKVGRS